MQQAVAQLPWGHVTVLLGRLKTADDRDWYAERAVSEGWSRGVLEHHIKMDLRAALGSAPSNFAAALDSGDSDLAQQLVKDTYVFEHLAYASSKRERDVEQALIDRLQDTLLEFGRHMALVGRTHTQLCPQPQSWKRSRMRNFSAVVRTNHLPPDGPSKLAAAIACHNDPVTRDTPPCERAYRRTLAVLMLAVALWAVAWAVLTPGFRSPDEQNHLNSVIRVAYGGGWPAPGDAHFAPVTDQAVAEAAYPADLPGRWRYRPDATQFVDLTPVPAADRTRITAENALPAPGTSATVDQMTQHPPAYYALGAAVLHATGTADARWDVALLTLRLLDVALFTATIPLAAATTRRLTGSRSAALVAAPFAMLIPQVGHILGSANNDALVVLTGAGVTYLAARVVTGDLRWRVVAAIGLVLGIGLLTKVMLAFAIPTVAVAYLLAPGPGSRPRAGPTAVSRAWRGFVALAVAFVVGGWWWARNWIVDGAVQPVGLPRDYTGMTPVPGDVVLSESIGRTAQAFFGNLSWLEIRLPGDLVALGSTLLILATLTAVVVPGTRRGSLTIALLPVGLAGGVIANALLSWSDSGVLVALQGRYVFGGLTALAALFAIALWQACRRSEARTAVVVPVLAGLSVLAGAGGLVWAFAAMYRGPGESVGAAWERWAAWSPLTGPAIAVVLAVVGFAMVVAVVATVRWTRARQR